MSIDPKTSIFNLPICPRCKDTKYVQQTFYCIANPPWRCIRCSIEWNRFGTIWLLPDSELKNKIKKESERLWIEAGKPDGKSNEFWLQAEKNIL